MYTGCFVQLLGVVGFVVYLVFGCLKEGSKSLLITLVLEFVPRWYISL